MNDFNISANNAMIALACFEDAEKENYNYTYKITYVKHSLHEKTGDMM